MTTSQKSKDEEGTWFTGDHHKASSPNLITDSGEAFSPLSS